MGKIKALMETLLGKANGVASLDANGKLEQMPSAADVGAFGFRSALPANADLNNYTQLGNYYCNSTTASTILNSPINTPFALHVLNANGRILQVLHENSTSEQRRFLYYRLLSGSNISKWYTLADTDYALPRDGSAAMTGNLTIQKSNSTIFLKGADGASDCMLCSGGNRLYFQSRNISGDDSNRRMLQLVNSLSQTDVKNAIRLVDYVDGDYTSYTLLHTGNKPASTYTGNGSDTYWEWFVGVGINGKALLVSSVYASAIVTGHGAIVWAGGEVVVIPAYGVSWNAERGVIGLATTSNYFNANGIEYSCSVI